MSRIADHAEELLESEDRNAMNEYLKVVMPKMTPPELQANGPKIAALYVKAYPNPAGLSAALQRARRWAGQQNPGQRDIVNAAIPRPRGLMATIAAIDTKRTIEANERPMFVDPNHILEVLNELDEDDRWENWIYVLLATGRRKSEPLVGRFHYHDKDHVSFTGTLKEGPAKLIIPVLPPGSAHELVRRSDLLRQQIKVRSGSTMVDVGRLHNVALAAHIQKVLAEPMASATTLRKIYVAVAYATYGSEVTLPAFIRRVLGHQKLTTSLSYSNVMLRPKTGRSGKDEADD